MLHYLFRKIVLIFLISISFVFTSAQVYSGIDMEIRNESTADKPNIIDLVILVKNESSSKFDGTISIDVPKGFRSISGNQIKVELNTGEKRFLPVKILVSNDAGSGDEELVFSCKSSSNELVVKKKLIYKVQENNALRLTAENPLIYMNENNINDSVEVKARVTNIGNKRQDVTVVFKIPETAQGTIFIEKKGRIEVLKDTVFSFKFIPAHILKSTQVTVNIAGFREPEKEIFGNTSVSIQNISSTQRYQDMQPINGYSSYAKNSITAAYRRIGDNADMYQVMGSGGFNLPSGYVFISGNIYTMSNQNDPIVNNTYISYHRGNSAVTLGNVNKMLEMPLFGRGAEYSLTSSDKDKKIELGFIDQSFNLVEKTPFLQNGYGLYARGTIGAQNASRSISGVYVFRNDPYEKADHNLLGTDVQYLFSKDWRLNAKLYSGMSFYEADHSTKPSLGVESQYSGVISKVNLNGSYFYSTDYYPGNRRGVLQIQQSFSKNIFKEHYAYANILVSDFSPKYFSYDYNTRSKNIRLDAGINFARKGNFGWGVGYQYQEETSNNYNSFLGILNASELNMLKAQRLTEYTSWTSPNKKHSSILGIEGGLVTYPDLEKPKFQMKLSGNYAYKAFSFSYIYQYGAYFLSEYAFSKMMNKTEDYKKLSLSAFYNKAFFKDKVNLTSGVSYTDDVLYGKAPSAFFNLKYSGKQYGLYLNSSWYNYTVGVLHNNMVTVEAGVTLNLPTNTLDPGKKGSIKAFVYYDNNDNGSYDEGDEAADGYVIMINNISFKSNKEGNIEYKQIPYGKYRLKQVIQQGWYYDEMDIEMESHRRSLEIPLHRNGTIRGKITYDFDAKTAQEFNPKLGGIIINVFQGEKLLQRISTDENGEFLAFLGTGEYRISLNESSLPINTYCEQTYADTESIAGKISVVGPFVIKVKEKKIRVKKFGN